MGERSQRKAKGNWCQENTGKAPEMAEYQCRGGEKGGKSSQSPGGRLGTRKPSRFLKGIVVSGSETGYH